MALPLARTVPEAHLYLDLHACECGETRFPRDSSTVLTPDGELAKRYTGTCPTCGRQRDFLFRLPEEIAIPGPDSPDRYGGPQPSELIDPGEWLFVADRYADRVPADPAGLTEQQRAQARSSLETAAVAIGEVLKFVPPGADAVPPAAFVSDRGRAQYRAEPGRFRAARLAAVRDAYRDLVTRF
jgi:hypothetical protein